jgi:hypothetical protein
LWFCFGSDYFDVRSAGRSAGFLRGSRGTRLQFDSNGFDHASLSGRTFDA